MSSRSWENPVNPVALAQNEVHVWRTPLNHYSSEQLEKFFAVLNTEEKNRALRFHFSHDRDRFIVARAILKKILGLYLNCDPSTILFQVNSYGKPELINQALQFNLSHTKEMAAYAVTLNLPIGIDIEYMGDKHDLDALAQRFFCANEYAALKDLPVTEKKIAFFNAWTRKEAFLKAIGQGLSYPLNQVEVTLLPNDPPEFIHLGPGMKLEEWFLHSLPKIENHAAALAVKGKITALSTWAWDTFC